MSAIGSLLLLTCLADPVEPPAVVRATPHFYGAVGRGVTATWTATPAGDDIALTLSVKNLSNPAKVRKPELEALPAFADRFQITPGSDPPPGESAVEFRWMLRPRSAAVTDIPSLEYRYYVSAAPPGKQLPTTYAAAIPLPVAVAPPSGPVIGPEAFFKPEPLGAIPFAPGPWHYAGLAALSLGVGVLWRVLSKPRPQHDVLRETMRAAIRGADADTVEAAVRKYLAAKYGTPPGATPAEVPCPECARLLKRCEAQRFGRGTPSQDVTRSDIMPREGEMK